MNLVTFVLNTKKPRGWTMLDGLKAQLALLEKEIEEIESELSHYDFLDDLDAILTTVEQCVRDEPVEYIYMICLVLGENQQRFCTKAVRRMCEQELNVYYLLERLEKQHRIVRTGRGQWMLHQG